MPPIFIVAVDVETANPNGDICAFPAVAVDMASGARVFAVTSLVNPGAVEGSRVTMGVHGISEGDVVGMPSIREVWARFLAEAIRCGSPPIYAHQASSERGWRDRALGSTALPDIECFIELISASRWSMPFGPSRINGPYRLAFSGKRVCITGQFACG